MGIVKNLRYSSLLNNDNNDGMSPIVDITKEGKATTITITDATGPKVATVYDGADGPMGERGPQGVPGPEGPQGEPGPQGEVGPQGPKGDIGPRGLMGFPGVKGDKGDKGDAGATGPQGETGPQGPKGDTGATGPQGPKGDAGVSPTIDVSKSGKVTTLTIKDATGTKTATINDGADGTGGEGGGQADWNAAEGEPGHVLNRTHYEELAMADYLPETSAVHDEETGLFTITASLVATLVAGATYSIVWNGVTYECVCFEIPYSDTLTIPCLGNMVAVGGEDTGEPFFGFFAPGGTPDFNPEFMEIFGNYSAVISALDGASEVVLRIHGEMLVVHKLDEKYIPATNNSFIVNGSSLGSLRTYGAVAEDDNYKMGEFAFAEGKTTKATDYASHAEGSDTTASHRASHAEGTSTTASGDSAHAEGASTTSSGRDSHAEGSATTASGDHSHSEGYGSVASGTNSHAEGHSTIASTDKQHVQGGYNIEDTEGKYAHIVGNGSVIKRSNAHTLDWNGNGWYQGDVYVGGTSQDDAEKLLKASDVAFPVAQAGVDLEAVTVVETTTADLNATDNDAHFATEALVVNSGPYKLTKDGMLALVDKKVTGDGSVQWNGWGSMTWGETASMLSGELKVRYMDDPIYMSMKLPSEQYHASNKIEHPGMRHANSTGTYTYLSTIGAVYAPDYTALPDTVTICIGNMSLYTLSDEPSANWVLHEHCNVPAGYGIFYIPWSACANAHVSVDSSKIEQHENYTKFTLSKSDFGPSSSVSASTGAVLHFWGKNEVDIDLTKCKAAIAMYEMWTETPEAADLLYIDIGADQKSADKTQISQLFWSRNYNIRTEKRLVCGHNISDELYDELRDTRHDPRHVLEHYYEPITPTPTIGTEELDALREEVEADIDEVRTSLDDMYVVGSKVATANLFDGVMAVGHFDDSGMALPSYTDFLMSVNYTPVTGGKSIMSILGEYAIGDTNTFYVCEYDANKTFIKRSNMRPSYRSTGAENADSSTDPKAITLDANTAYIRFSVYNNFRNNTTIEDYDLNHIKIAIAYTESNLTTWIEPYEITKLPLLDGAKLALSSPNGTVYTLTVSDNGTLSVEKFTI